MYLKDKQILLKDTSFQNTKQKNFKQAVTASNTGIFKFTIGTTTVYEQPSDLIGCLLTGYQLISLRNRAKTDGETEMLPLTKISVGRLKTFLIINYLILSYRNS